MSSIDLRKLREGLGFSLQYAAAIIGVPDGTLQNYETRGSEYDPGFTRDAVAAYAVHLAAWWAADELNLTTRNLDPQP